MRYNMIEKNLKITKGVRESIETKIGKLEYYFTDETEVTVIASKAGPFDKVEITIPVKGGVIRAEETAENLHAAVDVAVDTIERQLRKYKRKMSAKEKGHPMSYASENFKKAFSEDEAEETEEIQIIKTKKFGIKPMFPEDAALQMEMLGHDFFMFYNAETNETNVIYKRKDGNYGLIEPEF